VLEALRASFGISRDAEVTSEANPDDLAPARLDALAALGVNRLSIGVQSLVDAELAPLERRHDASAARDAVRRAVARFPRVSADLMIGIPGQTAATLLASLDGLLDAGVGHVSVYLLEIEKAPRLVGMKRARPELFADDEEMAARWEEVDARCRESGFVRYEISNWARPGEESRHNLKYWTLEETPGCGVAAHSYTRGLRRANTGMTGEYVARVSRDGTAFVTVSQLPPDAALREAVLLELRLSRGVLVPAWKAAVATLGVEDRERLSDREEAGLLERREGRIRLTNRGVLLSNEIFSCLL
jgi:oxygen-independent coproporphyrinogen-3 oxidase